MDAPVVKTLAAGSKIKYWDDRIATVVVAYDSGMNELVIEFDADIQSPKSRHYLYPFDFRLAEPM